MRAFVRFVLPDGSAAELGHGDLIGRIPIAALRLDDPRVSEAHALVSVRRGELVLLSLRRMFAVRGKPVTEAVLRAGMAVELADGLSLRIDEVHRPTTVLALETDGLGRRTLPGTASLHVPPDGAPSLSPRFDSDAALHVWWSGEGWRARAAGQTQAVGDGSVLRLGAREVRFVLVEVDGATTTPGAGAGLEAPLRLVAWYDGVEIHRDGRPPFTLSGVGARILSELVSVGGPVGWEVVAREVWREPDVDVHELRHRWDVTLARVRARLKEAGVRADLLRSTGAGLVQLVKYPADELEDRT